MNAAVKCGTPAGRKSPNQSRPRTCEALTCKGYRSRYKKRSRYICHGGNKDSRSRRLRSHRLRLAQRRVARKAHAANRSASSFTPHQRRAQHARALAHNLQKPAHWHSLAHSPWQTQDPSRRAPHTNGRQWLLTSPQPDQPRRQPSAARPKPPAHTKLACCHWRGPHGRPGPPQPATTRTAHLRHTRPARLPTHSPTHDRTRAAAPRRHHQPARRERRRQGHQVQPHTAGRPSRPTETLHRHKLH